MKIQFTADKTIKGGEGKQHYFTSLLQEDLKKYQKYITKIDVRLANQNVKIKGRKEILCLLETRLKGRYPIVVSGQADTIEQAYSGAIDKQKNVLEILMGHTQN